MVHDCVGGVTTRTKCGERSDPAGALRVREASIPPSSEGDKE